MPDQPQTLHCPACGRTQSYTPLDEMLSLVRGWPTCCGRDMVRGPDPEHDDRRRERSDDQGCDG